MDHYAPTHDLAQPWRTRTLIVTGVATVELLALVAVGIVLLGRGWLQHARATDVQSAPHHAAAPATRPRPHPSAPAAKVTPRIVVAPARPIVSRAHTELLVLNGNGQRGAAGAEARALRAHGYPIVAVDNARRNDYAASMVMYRPGYDREARRLARDVGIKVVTVLDGLLPGQLRGADLLIIVGR